MAQTYRVRYSMKPTGEQHKVLDVLTLDIQAELDGLLEHLPPAAYVMYIEDLTAAQNVHWTRWPKSFRPGFGG
jgi:hypothetical protein